MTAQDVADLYEEIQNLQCALSFWLPCVPEHVTNEEFVDRIHHDANLLAGYEGPIVKDAEDLGWISVTVDISTSPTSNSSETQDPKP